MLVLGIDPGLGGACAVLRDGRPEEVFDTPTLEVVRNRGRRREYHLSALVSEIARRIGDVPYAAGSVAAFLESVNAFPRQGVASMFSLGRGLGIWEGALAALRIPYTKVLPQAWKRVMLAGMGRGKEASRLRAQQLFPSAELHLKKHEGRAEALLLARYGRTYLLASNASSSV